jgi:hypothetical protein
MNKCNCKIENTILVGDELYQFLKNKQIIKIGNTLYAGPKIVKSDDGRHNFEIYEEIKVKPNKKNIEKLLHEIISKIDLLISLNNV